MRRGTLTLIIPNEHEGDIGPGFLQRLLRQAGISREEWLGHNNPALCPLSSELCDLRFAL